MTTTPIGRNPEHDPLSGVAPSVQTSNTGWLLPRVPNPPDPQAEIVVLLRRALVVGLIILLALMIAIGRSLLLPVTTAVIVSFALAPIVRMLCRWGCPRPLGAIGIVLVLMVGLGVGCYALSGQAKAWMDSFPKILPVLRDKLHALQRPVQEVQAAASQMATAARGGASEHQVVELSTGSTWPAALVDIARGSVISVVIGLITLIFLLSTGSSLLDRLVDAIPGFRDVRPDAIGMGQPTTNGSAMVLQETEKLICLYIGTACAINTSLGAVLAVCWWLVGLPNPLLWGACAAALNFFPYIGPVVGIVLIAIVSVFSSSTLGHAVLAPGLYIMWSFLDGNVIMPAIVGRRLSLNPLVIFLWMVLWGSVWGVVGALLAVPLLIMTQQFSMRIDSLRGIASAIK